MNRKVTGIIFCTAILFCLQLSSISYAGPDQYRVGVGDTLRILVAGEPDFSGTYTIRSDSAIFYSYLKAVEVGGLTTQEIADRLTDVLGKDYINNPIVSVSIKDYASRKIQILGAVAKPGSYILKGQTRILDIVSQAGGLTQKAGRNILVIRSKDQKTPPKETAKPDPTAKPQADQETAVQNATNDIVDPTETTNATPPIGTQQPLLAAAEPIVVNYSAIVEQGNLAQNILVEAGDVINVPIADEIYVLGQVKRPGSIKYESKLTILQAVSLAGGTSETASPKSTYIIRKDGKGKSQKIKVRLDRILAQKAENITLRANDVIVVPESFF